MLTGLVLYHGIDSGPELAGYARAAEQAGFDSIWVTERYFHEETFSLLGHLAASTDRMALGVGVVNPFTRHPALLAMAAATIDRLSAGRMVLGLGRSDGWLIRDRLGLSYESSLSDLERAAGTVRALLSGRSVRIGEATDPVRLAVPPVQSPPRIYLAAIGPRALRLAGAIADGVILNAYSPVGYVEWAVREIRLAAEGAGRDPHEVEIACMIVVRLTDDPGPLMPGLRRRVARLLAEPGMGRLLLGRAGLDAGIADSIAALDAGGESEEAAALVPEELVGRMYVMGSAAECLGRLDQYRRAGVTHPLLLPRLEDLGRVTRELGPGVARAGTGPPAATGPPCPS